MGSVRTRNPLKRVDLNFKFIKLNFVCYIAITAYINLYGTFCRLIQQMYRRIRGQAKQQVLEYSLKF